jgi:pilus assembly protein Flp/PilA
MQTIVRKVHRFLVSEDGPTAVEYAVMLALIIAVSVTAISSLGSSVSGSFSTVSDNTLK